VRAPLLLVALAGAAVVSAQEGPRFVEDEGHIAVFEHDGSNYDKKASSGELNLAPREELLRRFVETHGDFYDFVVIFTNFDFDRGGASGFYLGLRNDVRGIGTPLFDEGARFGSPKRLQGIIDMGPVAQYRAEGFSVEPSDPGFRHTLGILAHEVAHRWLANVRYLEAGEVRTDLLGRDQSHWSFLLSSDASFLYGSDWEPIGGGLYRASEVQSRYGALDLYLMGFASPDEVPPLVLLRNPDVDLTRIPELGAVVSATEDVVTLDQIVAAEGERAPSAAGAQKDFRLAFVFLSEKDLVASPLDLASVDRIREAFVTTFFSLTKGRGFVDTDLLNVIPPVPTTTPNTARALDFLLGAQKDDGRFEDHPRTNLRDTTVALETLDLLGVPGEPLTQAFAWLSTQSPASVDSLARAIGAGTTHDDAPLRAAQNADGGWGIGPRYRSDPLDAALALRALNRRGGFEPERARARQFLTSAESPWGGWSSIAGGAPDLLTTCAAVSALEDAVVVQPALAWLISLQQLDGGFGDGPSTPYATACVIEALLQGAAPAASVDRALEYLQKTERPDGSWEGSVFQTAFVLHALVPASAANLSIRATDVVLEPDVPEVGERVSITVTVRNRARVAASSFALELFDGDPELGGIEIGSTNISSLAAGGASSTSFSWDTTGLEGSHRLFAVADLAGLVPESIKTDNVAIRDVEVLPPLPNLVVESLVSSPASPPEGVAAMLTTRVTNTGSVPAPGSIVRLFEGHPSLGVVVGETSVPPLATGEPFEASFPWETAGKLGRRRLTAVVDPGNDLRERFENDNELALDVQVRTPPPPEPDLVLERKDLALSPPRLSTLPQEVVLTAFVRNTGANPVPATLVSLYQGANLIESQTLAVPGDGGAALSFTLDIATGGTRTYTVRVDENDEVLERSETNNAASIDLVDPMDTIDVALSGPTLSSPSITAGDVLRVEVEVANRGTRRLSAVSVSLFAASSFASTASLDLAPGTATRVELTWKANRLGSVPLEVRADPDGRLSELDETNNVVTAEVDVAGTGLPNLTVASSEIEVLPLAPVEGEPARISARIRNLGEVDATGFNVSFFGGDPDKGGIPLGSVAVASLLAGGDVVVSVDWSEVNLRGTTLLFVVIDSAEAVVEFDETDNRTFKVVDITGLADLAAATAAVRLDPAFPRSGDRVSIEATFANQGEREALDVDAEIRLDDPESGPVVGGETFAFLVPGEIASFTASWDTTGVEGEHTLFLVLDVASGVREQREDNNVASVPIALQDADFFATPLYFSPDGNGVQDEAAFFYRVAASSVSVHVADDQGILVRTLEADGSAVWDGRTDRGVLARDGDYFFVVESEGVELARKRVVLDTNRSSVAEALGSEFVSFSNLTCPLVGAFDLSGPAFLPDDSAAFFIARDQGAAEYPAGLYRASPDGSLLEPIATGDEFSSLRFFERFSPSQAQRIVSPDGRQALVRGGGGDLLLLDLETGAPTPLGRFASDARWSPNGEKLLVSDFDGIYLYSSGGELLTRLSSLGAELVEWSPDGSRIVYRPWEEMVLHVMSSDGSNDRVLAETDATKHIVDDSALLPSQLTLDKILWTRQGESIAFRWFHFNSEQFGGPFELELAGETLSPIPFFEEVSTRQDWAVEFVAFNNIQRFRGRERRSVIPPSVGDELHWSYRDTYLSYTAPPEPGCVGLNRYLVRSLLNGEARFRLTALPSGFGIRVEGTVADRNLDHYRLEYAPVTAPSALVPIQAPSSTPVVDDTITTWIPPSPGDYIVRLTLRDRAGNEVVRLDRVSWSRTLPIAGLRRSPPAISPNGDGVQDEAVVQYNVLDAVNLIFHVRDQAGEIVKTIARDEASLGPVSFAWDGTDDSGNRVPDGRYAIEVSGAELRVLVDATPPDVLGEISELYTFLPGGSRLGVDVSGLVQDENLEEWSLVPPEGDPVLSSVRPVGSATSPEMLVEGGLAIQGLELRARDVAGNLTVVPLTGPRREVRVVLRRSLERDIPIGPFEPGAPAPIPSESLLPNARFGWNADASFVTNELRFVYAEEGSGATTEIPTGGRLRLSARDFPVGRRFVGRFEADGVTSQEVSFAVGPDAIFLEPVDEGSSKALSVVHTLEEELVEGTIFMMVGAEKTVFKSYRPVPRRDLLLLPRTLCGIAVSFHLEAFGASGKLYRSTTALSYPAPAALKLFVPGCSGVVDAAVASQRSPDSEIPSTASAKVYLNVDPRPDTIALELTRGAETTEVARVAPEGGFFDVPFDVGTLPEASYRLLIPDGEFTLSFGLDQSPPDAAFLSPVEGGNACVVREEDEEWVALDVSGRDQRLTGFSIELLGDDGVWAPLPTKGGPPGWPVPSFQSSILARVPMGLEGQKRLRLVVATSRLVNEGGGSAQFPALPLASNNGSLLGAAVRNVVIVRQQTLGPVESLPALFSPNLTSAHVLGGLTEAARLTVRVYRIVGSALVRTVSDGQSFGTGPFDIAWDGLDDLGQLVADGEYRVEVVAVNGCGARSTREVKVEVDATAPTVEITSPGTLQPVSIAVDVLGTATDLNLESYRLSLDGDALPPVLTRVERARLGTVRIGELAPGIHTLRLVALDRAGNESSTFVEVDVVSPDIIASFGAEPSFVNDTSEISFRLKRDALVTLTIGPTVILQETRSAGDHTIVWDAAVADGEYVARLVAEDVGQEEATLSLVVDTAPPSIELTAPSAFVALPSSIFGRVQDQNLERYQIDLGPEDGALSRIDEDSVSAEGALASLIGLEDGRYRLLIRASDRAGNVAELPRSFDVDSTPPVVEILDLAAQVSTAAGPLVLRARVTERNLESYALEVGAGASPSVFVPLASGAGLPSAELEASWDVSVLPDGVYTVRLRAGDSAGSAAETSRQLVLDGTPPEVAIESPAEGGFASRDAAVLGTASDENLAEAALSLARAEAPLQEIARFEAPVLGGVLRDGLPFEDGAYRLSLTAKDVAGNVSTVERSFHLDSEPPSPPEGLRAAIEERASVRLTWEPSPERHAVVRDGVLLAQVDGSELLDGPLPEGRYVYVVVAIDGAGLESEPATVEVRIDLTPPMVALRSPDEGERVRALVDVVGTVFSEADFKEYRLSVASAATPASPTLLKKSPLPVSFGTLFQWEAIALDGAFLLTLEGEDTSGNVASETVQVVVDNQAPDAPVLTSVSDGEVVWEPSSAGDVSGYLVFRNGRVANAPGTISGDLRPFLVPAPRYEDADLPDGRFCYLLVAMDQAGNLSFDSNEICIFLDNRVPEAVLVEPEDGARFDAPRTLRAVTEDEDVATVLFQFQGVGALVWTDIASDGDAPFEISWDITGIAFGDYRLRAVATDAGSRSDPDPAFITVTLADSTAPAVPVNFVARVEGDTVTLTWDAVNDAGLAGYRLYRGGALVATLGLETTAIEAGRSDGLYEYQVSAFDSENNESPKSEAADARVYRPLLLPAFPIFEGTTDLPGEGATADARVELFFQGTATLVAETTVGPDGRFVFTSLALPLGESLLEARATDLEANRSRVSEALFLLRNEAPSAPAGLAGVVNGLEATLSWTANAEVDLSGYIVRRDGESLIPTGRIRTPGDIPTTLTASGSAPNAPRAIDGSTGTVWTSSVLPSFLEVAMTPARHLREVRIFWGFRVPRDFRVFAEISGRLVPLAAVRGNTSSNHVFPFPREVRTGRIRVEVTAFAPFSAVDLREVELYGSAPLTSTSATDTPDSSAIYAYGVSAIDVFGGESAPSSLDLGVGDVTPPEPPVGLTAAVTLADVALSWTPSTSPDVAFYRIYRDGTSIGDVPGTSFTDFLLPDGLYRYQVAAVDGDDNESARSNEAVGEVSVDSPTAPSLSVSVVPEGRALALDWSPATGPLGVTEYSVFRSTSSGGAGVEIARTPELGLVDDGLANGVTYFYVVRALDPRGEASLDSNEASGTPSDSAPPEAPVFLRPTTAGVPIAVTTARATLSGRSEPSSRVSIFRGSDRVGEVDAASSLEDSTSLQVSELGARAVRGMKLADVDSGGIRLWDFETGALQNLAFDADESVNGVAFSPGGDRLAIAAGSSLHVTWPTEVFTLSGSVSSPEWVTENSIAVVVDGAILLLDLGTGATEEIFSGSFFDPPRELRLSRGGSRLAFLRSGILEVLELSTRASTNLGFASEFSWMSDEEIAFSTFDGLRLADLVLGTSSVVPETSGVRFPTRLGPGEVVALSADNEVVLIGADVTTLGPMPVQDFDLDLFTATEDFRVLVVDSGESRARLFSLPGRFELRDVALFPGVNEMSAEGADAGGNRSSRSAPLEIAFDDSLLPDLALEGLLAVPAVPASGDVASVSVTVRNAGASVSGPSFVQFFAIDGLGERATFGSVAAPALLAGGSTVVSRAWDTAGLSGAFTLLAEADPLGTLDEKDESNNAVTKSVSVVTARGVGLGISTGLSSYSSGEDVEIRVEAVNGGASSEVTLETVIEDALGVRLATVDRRSALLDFGEASAYTVFWNTGRSLAGTYRARVLASGASAADEFQIRRLLDVRASVTANRRSFLQGEAATLVATVTNLASNAPLRNLTLSFAAGGVFEANATLEYLAMGGSASASVSWLRIDGAPGVYPIHLLVLESGLEIASASGSLEVRQATDVELSGTLALESAQVPASGEIVARFEIENLGVLPLVGGSARVALFNPMTGLSTLFEDVTVDVAPGAVFTEEVRLDTAGEPLGRHSVVLSVGSPLASASVTLFAVPAPPSLNAPAEGASAAQPLRLSVNNASNPNGERLLYEFEIYFDESLQFLLGSSSGIPEGANATAWIAPLELSENRRYYWRARARDRFAASDWMPPASLFADTVNEPPSAPVLSSPAAATEVVTRMPVLVVGNSLDPEGAPLIYTFEVYADSALVFSNASVAEGNGETSVDVTTLLDEDGTYVWRARSSDGELDSDWMPEASFRVNTENGPPTKPVALRPVGGADVASAQPELAAKGGLDPEAEAVLHRVEIDRSPSFDTASLQSVDSLFATGAEVRWTPPVPLAENEVYFWRVRASDGTASSDWSDTATFRVDVANEAPSIPRPESPLEGALVESSTPTLVLVNASDPEGDALRYDFEVYDGDSLVAQIQSVREGEGRTAWTVSPRLEEDRTHRFRARARDSELVSDWSAPQSFLVNVMNSRPSAPSLGSPPEGSLVSSLPVTLEVVNAVDLDGDALSYRFEVYEDPDLLHLIEASGPVPESSPGTSWEMTAALHENHIYYWRARASDGLDGPWMPTARFRFSLASEAPTAPVLAAPQDGATVAESRPLLTIEIASDPDGDLVRYVFEIYDEGGVLVVASPAIEDTTWQVPQDLVENETYFWQVLATDGAFTTPSQARFSFRVDAVEEAPLAPTPIAPDDGSTVATRTPALVVRNGVSPDGRALHYHFELLLVASDENVPEGPGETRWEVPVELTPGLTYTWRARAIDDRGLASEWSASFTFTVEGATSECPPEWRERFESPLAGWRLRREVGNPQFEVHSGELESRFEGRGALLFEGSGESAGWRNYELRGELELEDDGPSNCGFGAGVVFYSTTSGEYRLDVTTPECHHPKARLVKALSGGEVVLLQRSIDDDFDEIRFRVEVVNGVGATDIRVELEGEDESLVLEVSDGENPLRAGTVGAWSNFAEAEWDDFHVREVPGFESGISGDEDGDGVCDNETPICSGPVEVCLDGGQAVVSLAGSTGHSGPTACGATHAYWVGKKTGVLFVESGAIEAGRYKFRLLLHRGEKGGGPVVRVELESGASFDVAPSDGGGGPFVWSRPFEVDLPAGVLRFRIRSLVKATVHVEAFRLECACE
jgi:subtilase family serine protease/flagellar hook assembly protein FlgD